MSFEDAIRDALRYQPDTGKLFWTKDRSNVSAGSEAGSYNGQGYRKVLFQRRTLLAHRVAWLLVTGEWPAGPIDHANCDRSDNRWSNLRLADWVLNNANKPGFGRFAKGVTLHKCGRYQASIGHNGRSIYLGLFDRQEDAAAAYAAKAREFFGEFARVA